MLPPFPHLEAGPRQPGLPPVMGIGPGPDFGPSSDFGGPRPDFGGPRADSGGPRGFGNNNNRPPFGGRPEFGPRGDMRGSRPDFRGPRPQPPRGFNNRPDFNNQNGDNFGPPQGYNPRMGQSVSRRPPVNMSRDGPPSNSDADDKVYFQSFGIRN